MKIESYIFWYLDFDTVSQNLQKNLTYYYFGLLQFFDILRVPPPPSFLCNPQQQLRLDIKTLRANVIY